MKIFADELFEELEERVKNFPTLDFARREIYVRALMLCYQTMVASEPLLKICASKEGDHKAYFQKHVEEEHGHEVWMEKDIRALGGDISKAEVYPEVIAMVGAQYYLCSHISPLALLGYMALMEGFPQSAEKVRRLKELYPEAYFTLEYHAKNDVEHRADLIAELNKVPVEWQEYVRGNALNCAELYHNALWRLLVTLGE